MSTLYLLLPQSSHLPHLIDMVCTLLAGGHPIEANHVQPVVYSSNAIKSDFLHKLTHKWPSWLDDLKQNLPTLSPAIGISTTPTGVHINEVPQWCHDHVMAYEALTQQFKCTVQNDDYIVALFDDLSQLPWAYAIRAYFGPATQHVAGVWQMPQQALTVDDRLSAAYEPQLTALQQIIPMMCTGLRTDATTHAGFTLVETAAALLHTTQKQSAPLMCVSQRGQFQYYTPQHLPSSSATLAMQRVALWQAVANAQNLMPALKRIHADGKGQALIQNSPVLLAMTAIRNCQRQWIRNATYNSFTDGLIPQNIKDVSKKLQKAIVPLDVTANDTQRIQALLEALAQVLSQSEALLPNAEGSLEPVKFSDDSPSLGLIPFLSPTAWMERTDLAFSRYDSLNDDEAKRLRQQVMALWYEFFQEEVHGDSQQLVVKEMRLSAFSTLKQLLPLTEMGRRMLEADIFYEVSLCQSPNVLLAISSPTTGFALAPGQDTFTDYGDLHQFKNEFVRFLDAYIRMFPESFSPDDAFRRYVEHEKALLTPSERTDVESARANVMAEYPAFAHHIGIEPSH